MTENVRLYPWFQFFRNLLFWQATWFLFFQGKLSAAEAILLYAAYDLATMVLEVPSGWLSDKIGRRITLILSAFAALAGTLLLAVGDGFVAIVIGQCMIGAGAAFASGTDSSLLYESLASEDRTEETEAQELRAWRFGFFGLALSAVTGGAMAMAGGAVPFWASAVAAGATLMIALRFREPTHLSPSPETWAQIRHLGAALRKPFLLWLMALTVLMYGFSHIPFIFGQPLILETMEAMGEGAAAPLVSGAIATVMMLISVAASWLAPALRRALGLGGLLVMAFAMQVGLVGVMTLGDSLIVIAFLMLRMVPDAFAKPFVAAAIQPELTDDSRATYLSLKSLFARLAFAASLSILSVEASSDTVMALAEIRTILSVYLMIGLAGLAALVLTIGAIRRRKQISRK